jgi:UDPglucose--hexose-1-phosphate uridylyltransferase
MPHNELRKDYLLNRWVVIAKDRARRPTDLAKPRPERSLTSTCPLCAGNESMTPPAIMLYRNINGKITQTQDPITGVRPKDWLVRIIPNLYPAFTPPTYETKVKNLSTNPCFSHAIGHHEVVVESPDHNEEPSDARLPQLELILKAYIARHNELSTKEYIKYVSIFRNYGIEAGASLSHAHSQIIATPMVPTIVQEEQGGSKKFFNEHKKCVFCSIIEKERKSPRLILENEAFVVLAPYASVNPLEFWILPKQHASNIANLSETEISVFARTIKTTLKALKDIVNDPPYNYAIHLSIDPQTSNYYHWHLEVYPKLAIWAGFEKSTGLYINTVTPENAAESMRDSIKT